jgi:hypothetical protein
LRNLEDIGDFAYAQRFMGQHVDDSQPVPVA